jgi:AcrR family transcriptional regulator
VPSKAARDTYHHGDLANALTQAATELALAGGPEAVVLREAARQVGVSATAAYRYFESRAELINAVKERALAELAARMNEELDRGTPLAEPIPESLRRLRALGLGYVKFALERPGLFRTAFFHSSTAAEQGEVGLDPINTRPFQMLIETLDSLVKAGVIAVDRRPFLELAAWSTVHGIADLVLDGPLRHFPPEVQQAAIDRALDMVIDGIPTR